MQPGVIKIEDDIVNMNSQIFMIELNCRVKYPKGMFNIEVNAGVIRSCGEKSNSSERALALGHGQLATASGEVAEAGKPGQRIGPEEEASQMAESQGARGIHNL